MMRALTKSHKSTVCIIPPLAVQQAVQRIRCFKDKSFVRWPPHINLLYPFLEDPAFEEAATAATAALAQLPPFKVKLDSLSFFEHSANSYTLWLDAADKSGLLAAQSALQAAFPTCSDLSQDPSRGITSFTPHLSLGQWTNKQQLLAAIQEYSADGDLLGMQFEVSEVCLCSRQGYRDSFSVRYAVPLGTATPSAPYTQPQLVDVPYIATTTPNLHHLLAPLMTTPTSTNTPSHSHSPTQSNSTQTPHPSHYEGLEGPQRCEGSEGPDKLRFGVGALPQGLWNFAYGANMSPQKLGGSRGLHPITSQPGVLRGYSLAFNHRGGFGNIQPAGTAGATAVVETAAAAVGADLAESSTARGSTSTAGDTAIGHGPAKSSTAGSRPVATAAGTHTFAAGGAGAAPSDVYGVLLQLTPAQLADLMCMEHEYEPVVVLVQPYDRRHQQQQQKQERQVQQQEQQHLMAAIAFQSPPERLTSEGLPPTHRYMELLRDGAKHWQLDQQYTAWLHQHKTVAGSSDRGPQYYTSPAGQPLPAWPKIRTGGSQQNSSKRGGRGGGRGGKGSRGGGKRPHGVE